MTTRQIKSRLLLATAAMLVVALCAAGWALWVPVEVNARKPSPTALARASQGGPGEQRDTLPTLEQLRAMARKDLRRPLKDPPPPEPPPPVPLQAKLLGVIFEPEDPGQSMAMFKLSDGTERWLKAGQVFEDPVGRVEVTRVRDRSVTVTYKGQATELSVDSR